MDKKAFEIASSISDAFNKGDIRLLRKISNNSISEYSISRGHDLFLLSLISYTLAKLLQKPHYWKDPKRLKVASKATDALKSCITFAEEGNALAFTDSLNKVITDMTEADIKDKRFVIDIFEKAKIKAAARLYAQGISLGSSSELTGVDKRDILDYAGKTMMFDRFGKTKTMKERLQYVRRLFK